MNNIYNLKMFQFIIKKRVYSRAELINLINYSIARNF